MSRLWRTVLHLLAFNNPSLTQIALNNPEGMPFDCFCWLRPTLSRWNRTWLSCPAILPSRFSFRIGAAQSNSLDVPQLRQLVCHCGQDAQRDLFFRALDVELADGGQASHAGSLRHPERQRRILL
jgi:hypothetical protein